MNSALETLISQAIGAAAGTGGSTKSLSVVYLNRGRMIVLIIFIPIVVVLLKIDTILVSLGQDALTAENA